MNFLRALFFTALAFPSLASAANDATVDQATLYGRWMGDWKGVLEYRDYQPPHGRVRLPTTLSVTPAADHTALILHFVYDDGPNKTVTSTSRLVFDPAARTLTWADEGKAASAEDTFKLSESTVAGDRLVFLGEAMDDNKPSQIRLTFTTSPTEWRLLKETTSDGPAFAFRHEYRLKR